MGHAGASEEMAANGQAYLDWLKQYAIAELKELHPLVLLAEEAGEGGQVKSQRRSVGAATNALEVG